MARSVGMRVRSTSGFCQRQLPQRLPLRSGSGPRLKTEDFNSKGEVMKKLFAVVMAVLTSLGLAWAQAWNHDPASPIGPLHWGTVTPSYATCGDSITGEAGMKQLLINMVSDNALAASFSDPLFKYKRIPLKIENTGHYVEMPYDPTSYLYAGSQPTDVYQLVQ